MKYFLQVFGCQMNTSDAERLRTILEQSGYEPTAEENDADLIAVIACAVRQSPVDRVYGRARRWQKWKKIRPVVTALTGCILDHDKDKLSEVFDYVFPITELGLFAKRLADHDRHSKPVNDPTEYFLIPPKKTSAFQAYLPISIGCNKFCSYCAVPYTRGRETSRDPKDIIREAADLVSSGYREITLLGQNVNSYGNDFEGIMLNLPDRTIKKYERGGDGNLTLSKRSVAQPMDFPMLLQTIARLPGRFWVRFLTSHPYDFSDKLISVMAGENNITPYLHLPIQSGSDCVLKRMNRLYTVEQYRDRVASARLKIPGLVLTTDIIVGFPGETADDFEQTCRALEEFEYDLAYLAQYSPRPGTKSLTYTDDVPRLEKKKRENKLNDLLAKVARRQNDKYLKTDQVVLFDRYKNGYADGRTYGGKNIRVPSRKKLTGEFRTVRVTRATPWHLSGEL